jgi:hypothetical protein
MKTGRFMGMFGAMLLVSVMYPETDNTHFRGFALGGYNPVYFPRRGKLKGYMRENKRCSFNKNR